MEDTLLDRLRFLLRALREQASSKDRRRCILAGQREAVRMTNRVLPALLAFTLISSAGWAEGRLTYAVGDLLKPGTKRSAAMSVYPDRILFNITRDRSKLEVERADIKGIQYQSGQRRASVGTIVSFGLLGAVAGKRHITTLGIEKTDGKIIIFRWKGKDTLHVTMALDQFMERFEQASGSSPDASSKKCTTEQIAAMARTGLTDDQIKAACEGSDSPP